MVLDSIVGGMIGGSAVVLAIGIGRTFVAFIQAVALYRQDGRRRKIVGEAVRSVSMSPAVSEMESRQPDLATPAQVRFLVNSGISVQYASILSKVRAAALIERIARRK